MKRDYDNEDDSIRDRTRDRNGWKAQLRNARRDKGKRRNFEIRATESADDYDMTRDVWR